ncbi:MAG: BON domain-containing protein [Rubrivivax sp.]|jgi:hypothetical protein|nr:BON domain-containing protein [Rubrivivax sp.]
MNFNRSTRHLTLIAAATAALLLSACGRDDNQTVGQKIDGAIATTERNVEQARTDASQKMAEAKDTAERATDKVAEKVDRVVDAVGNTVADAALTASVNAELAKDSKLSAMRIDVDTTNGRVLLQGKAPDAASRDRATRLAEGVKGVNHVENRLQIGG